MAKHWSDMSKDERASTSQTKKEYNKSTGQERYAEGGELEHKSLANNFDQKWSELSQSDSQKMKAEYGSKQGWQDAKARSQGFTNEQARRDNSGERHLNNNPGYVTPSTPSAQTQNSQALNNEHSPKANDVGAQAKPTPSYRTFEAGSKEQKDYNLTRGKEAMKPTEFSYNFGLSNDPNKSMEDIRGDYMAIAMNERLFGAPEGRDLYKEAGLKNPNTFLNEYRNGSTFDKDRFNAKFGSGTEDDSWDVYDKAQHAMGKVYSGGGWGYADTMDRATFNLDPDGYAKENPELFGDRASGERGYNPNDDEFRATYDYSTKIPVMRNSTTDGIWAKNLEDSMGQSIEDMNKNINPNSGIDYSMGYSERSGGSDYGVYRRASLTEEQDPDSVRDKGNIDELHRSGNYGQGFYEKMANDPIQNLYDPHGHFTNYDFTPYKKGGSKYSGLYR